MDLPARPNRPPPVPERPPAYPAVRDEAAASLEESLAMPTERALEGRLAELVAARICHDLGSPIASICALLPQAGEPAAHEVVSETAGELRARLGLFGALFGTADEAAWPDLARLLGGAPMAHRVRFALPAGGAPLPPGLVRLYLAAALVAAEALPRGGTVEVGVPAPGQAAFRIEGRQPEWSPVLAGLLAGGALEEALEAGPRRVLAPWLVVLASREGQAVSFALPAGGGEPALLISPAR